MKHGAEQELRAELRRLCRGWAVQRPRLHNRMGENLSAWATVPHRIPDDDARQQIIEALDRLANCELSAQQKVILNAALSLNGRFPFSTLQKRTEVLAGQLAISPRTARRRIDEVLDRVAHLIANTTDPDDPETGWAVERLNTLVRLDNTEPEVIEQRTIIATRTGLRRISARFSLPHWSKTTDTPRKLAAHVLYGARIVEDHQDSKGHFRHLLELPHGLVRGEKFTYSMAYRVTDGHPLRPYYVMVPSTACAALDVRIRFAIGHEPRAVWPLEHAHYQVLPDLAEPTAPLIEPDRAGEVRASFTALRPGFGYGIAWTS